ncbi:hypothetical protein GEMRC1_003206 [Eukaryota sp. GEM-RC1]
MLVVLHSNRHSVPYKAPLLAQYEAESPAWILSPLSRYMDSFFSSPVDVMLPPCCLYLTQYEAESPAWILSPLSRYMDSFFSSPVDVMLPPCCLYLTQYEAESPAWILSPLSRYMDSFFYVVKTLPSLLLYVLYFYSCVIPSHPPFPKDLTADGDIESNPGPLSKDSLEYLNPGQWIDDDAIFQYCEYLFSSAGLAFDLYCIFSSVMNGLITDLSPEHKQTVDHQIFSAKTTGTRFLIAPINDGMTALSASRTFSGSHWGVILLDCVQNVATVIDPILNSNFLNPIVDKFSEKMPSFTIRYANVPKSQTPSDCGIYVIAYVQKYLQILTTHESLSNLSIDFF